MNNMKKSIILITAACLLAIGCERKNNNTTGAIAKEYLDLWMQEYHPGVSANANGVYILEDEAGTGNVWNKDLKYSRLTITIRGFNGKITSTGHEEYAKQLGTYETGDYYGPNFTTPSTGYAGVEAMLTGMQIGGTRTAVIPAWLLTTDRYSTQQEYLNACSTTSSLIYTITLWDQTDDIAQWEQDKVGIYAVTNFPGSMIPASFNDATKAANIFYFYSDASRFQGQDTLKSNAKILINYTGRLLNGTVFDTTLEKEAKDNGIYDSSRTYAPVTITRAEDYSGYAMNGSTSLVDGFKGALFLMKYAGEKSIAVFTSDLGYTASGSGTKIPSYAPLRFDLEIVSVVED